MKHLLPLLALLACTRPALNDVPDFLRPDLLDHARVLRASLTEQYPPRGSTRELQVFGQSCRWNGPNAIVLRPRTEPRVGTPLIVGWQMSAVAPAPTPAPAVALLLSFSPLATPLVPGELAPGCALLVNPEHILVPQADGWLRYDQTKQIVTMEFTPAPGLEGVTLYTQLLIARPGANQLGLLVSNGLEIHIGIAR